jgi:hypothetical protein
MVLERRRQLFRRQEAIHLCPTNRAGAFGYLSIILGFFNDAVLDGSFRATLDTVSFEFHGKSPCPNISFGSPVLQENRLSNYLPV